MKHFFLSLIDLKFEHFITRKVAGIFYAITLGAIVIGAIVTFFIFIVGGVSIIGNGYDYDNGAGFGLVLMAFVIVPVGAFVSVLLTRLLFESSVALVAVAENTKK